MDYDLVIIGSGPGGYVAAIRAGQTGLKTAIIEKADIGGMCLNWGCIPTKALMESAKRFNQLGDASKFGIDGIDKKSVSFNWSKALKRANRITTKLTKGVEYLLKKNGVEIIKGTATIDSADSVSVENRKISAKNIIIATGSRTRPLDVELPEEHVVNVWELLQREELPQKIAVIGSGPNALELAQIFSFAGRDVFLLLEDDSLLPGTDSFLADFAEKKIKKDKINLIKSADIKSYKDGKLKVGNEEIAVELMVNARQRAAVIPDAEIEIAEENGFIKTNEFLQTNHENIFAIGDVNGISMLAHAASSQGLHAVNFINGVKESLERDKYPLNIYTYPEMAQIGKTEADLKDSGIEYKVSEFPLSANGKALTENQMEGKIRLLSETKYGEVLGVQIIADHATDMIAEAATLMTIEGTIFDLAHVIHAHPTVSEVFMEAGFEAVDKAIHI